MEVLYADDDLRKLCASYRDLRARYGDVGAKRILQRIQILGLADTIDDVMQGPGRCHPLKGAYYEACYALRLDGGFRLIFRLATDEEKEAAKISTGQAAVVVEITDYHDG